MFKNTLEVGSVSGPPLPFRVKAFVSLMSVVIGFALSYLVWGVVSLVQFDRVLDAGSMIFYPGLMALGLWLAVLLPLTLKFDTDHKIFRLEGSILRGGGTTLGLYLTLLAVLQLGFWGGMTPVEMFKLLPGISVMFMVVAFLLGAITLPLYIIFSRFLRAAFPDSASQSSPGRDRRLKKAREQIEALLQAQPDTPQEWDRTLRKVYQRLPGAEESSLPAPPSSSQTAEEDKEADASGPSSTSSEKSSS